MGDEVPLLSPLTNFKPDYALLHRIREATSGTVAHLAHVAGLDPARDFRYVDLRGLDWRGTDRSQFDVTGSTLDDEPGLSKEEKSDPQITFDTPVASQSSELAVAADMAGTEPTGSLVNFVADAAAQKDLLYLDKIDREENHYQLIYAVDSNVLDIYVDPQDNSASSSERVMGAGDVFRTNRIETKAAITRAVGEFIWFRLTDRPLLLIPPVDVEVAALLRIATRDTQQAPQTLDRIKALIDALGAEDLTAVENAASELANLLSRTTRASRLFQLKNQRRFLNADEMGGYSDAIPAEVAGRLGPMSTIDEMIRYAEVRRAWEGLLTTQTRRRGDIRLERDIDSIALLEVWNRRLALLSQPWRLVYITTDISLHRAGSEMAFHSAKPLPDDHALGRKGTTFRDAYLRHPRSYLDRPGVLRRAPYNENANNGADYDTSFRYWIDLLLGDFEDRPVELGRWDWPKGWFELAESVQAKVEQAANRKPELLDDMLDRWGQFSRHVEALVPAGELAFDDPGDMRGRGYEALRASLDKWLPKIEQRVVDTWGACVLVFTEARFLFNLLRGHQDGTRHTARLCLEGDEAVAFLLKAEGWVADPKAFDIDAFEMEKSKAETNKNAGYNFYVVTAYLLAQGAHWQSAAFLCAHAASLAPRSDNGALTIEKHGPNGREAAYLQAFCRRHAARRVEELARLRPLLDQAREIYRQEQVIDPSLDAVPERFDTEEVALDYAELMFEWYRSISRADPTPPDVEQLRALAEHIGRLKDRVAGELSNPNRQEERVYKPLRGAYRRLLVNLVSIGLMHPQDPTLAASAQPAFVGYHQTFDAPPIEYPSTYVKVVMTCGGAHFGDKNQARQWRRDARSLLEKELAKDRSYAPITPPYELQRYRVFRDALPT